MIHTVSEKPQMRHIVAVTARLGFSVRAARVPPISAGVPDISTPFSQTIGKPRKAISNRLPPIHLILQQDCRCGVRTLKRVYTICGSSFTTFFVLEENKRKQLSVVSSHSPGRFRIFSLL